MSEQNETMLVIFTAVLAVVTGVLAWVTWRLGNITRESTEKTNALAVRPFLVIEPVVFYYEGGNARIPAYWFNVKNTGNGDAVNPKVRATVGGKDVNFVMRPEIDFLRVDRGSEVGEYLQFYIRESEVTDDLKIEIECQDIEGRKVKPLVRLFPKDNILPKKE
jgi:hypothetical protein